MYIVCTSDISSHYLRWYTNYWYHYVTFIFLDDLYTSIHKKGTSLQIKSSVLFLYKEDEMTEAILVNY